MWKDFGLAGVMGVHFMGTSDHSPRWTNYPNWVQAALNILKPEHPILDHPQMGGVTSAWRRLRGVHRLDDERGVGDRKSQTSSAAV